MEPRNLNMA